LDSIIQAVDLMKANELASRNVATGGQDGSRRAPVDSRVRMAELNESHLEKARIVAHKASPESKSFDVLRSQVLQELDKNGWQCLGITSPTAKCGKSTIACNLAISIARLAERGVILVDFDLTRPAVAEYLGLRPEKGVADVLQLKASPSEAIINAVFGSVSLLVLPGKGNASHSSDLLASHSMDSMLQTLKREFRNYIIILDLPSVLTGDEVMSILPRIDAAILVTSAGTSTIADVRDCRNFLERTPILRVVVNKRVRSKNGDTRY
jgi:protein-tyrosine kinase